MHENGVCNITLFHRLVGLGDQRWPICMVCWPAEKNVEGFSPLLMRHTSAPVSTSTLIGRSSDPQMVARLANMRSRLCGALPKRFGPSALNSPGGPLARPKSTTWMIVFTVAGFGRLAFEGPAPQGSRRPYQDCWWLARGCLLPLPRPYPGILGRLGHDFQSWSAS